MLAPATAQNDKLRVYSCCCSWHSGPSSEVNEQLTEDDLLSFMENQETALQDNNSSWLSELDPLKLI